MSVPNRHPFERGFTLIELVAILVLLGILSVAVLPRLMNSDAFDIRVSEDQIKSSIATAQQLALSGAGTVVCQVNTNSISVTVDGTPVTFGGVTYPLNMPGSILLSTHTFNFDKLGRTSAATIVVSQGGDSGQVNVEASGYAY